MSFKLYPEKLYDLNADCYCGVLMPKDVMQKVVKILHKNSQEIQEIFRANKDRIPPHHWTMSDLPNPTYVKFFIEKNWEEEVNRRISLFKLKQPEPITECYIVEDYNEGQKIANFLKQQKLIDNPPNNQ